MKQLTDIDCYVSGLYNYYDEIVSQEGVCDMEEFSLLSDFKVKLDEFNLCPTTNDFEWLYKAYEAFYENGYLRRRFLVYDLQNSFDCLSELMMRLKRICGRADKV